MKSAIFQQAAEQNGNKQISKRHMEALNKIRALSLPAPIRKKEQQEETVVQPRWKTSLPVQMTGGEFQESEIPDAPIREDLPENLLFDRPVNKNEWSGIQS